MLQEVSRDINSVADAIVFVKDVANIIRESSKRRCLYDSLVDIGEDFQHLLCLCPTRWCVRAISMKRVRDNYKKVMQTITILTEDKSVREDARKGLQGS